MRSRPRSSVIEATIATRMAGTAAITENRPTMLTCSWAAARPRRRAWMIIQTSRPITAIRNSAASALRQQEADHDLMRRRRCGSARSARRRSAAPRTARRRRRSGRAIAPRALRPAPSPPAPLPKPSCRRSSSIALKLLRYCTPASGAKRVDVFIQHCCVIATIRRQRPQNRAIPEARSGVSCWSGSPGYRGRGSSCAGCCG